MVDVRKRISEIDAATALTGDEILPVVQGGATRRSTVDGLLTIPASGDRLARNIKDKLGEVEVSLTDFTGGAALADNTAALQAAIDYAAPLGRTVAIPGGDFAVLGSITTPGAVTIRGRGPESRITGSGQDFITATASLVVSDCSLSGFGNVAEHSASGSIDRIGFFRCEVSDCDGLIYWADSARDKTVSRVDVVDCVISGMADYCVWIEAQVQSLYFERNEISDVARYVVRTLFGDASEVERFTYHFQGNKISNVHSGAYAGASAVARVFQVAADRVWVLNNDFSDISVSEGSAANVSILYGDVRNLWVVDNSHKDCGKDDPTGFLYQDKSAAGESKNHSYRGNVFTQSSGSTYTYGLIQSAAQNVAVTGNQFEAIRGVCFYAGWAATKNVTYSNNQHLGLRGVSAARFYGAFENVAHSGNIYDGITNDLSASDSGRLGAWFVDILQSSAATPPKWFKSTGNIYRNVAPVDVTAGRIAAAVVVSTAGASGNFEHFTWRGDEFASTEDGIHFRGSPSVVAHATIEDCEFDSTVTNKIRFASGATFKPTSLKVRNNRGFVTEARGQATIPNGSAQVTISHGLTGLAAGSSLRVSLTPSVDENIWVTGKLVASFNARRAGTVGDHPVDWFAEYEP